MDGVRETWYFSRCCVVCDEADRGEEDGVGSDSVCNGRFDCACAWTDALPRAASDGEVESTWMVSMRCAVEVLKRHLWNVQYRDE